MFLTLHETDKRPIYQQITDGIKDLIARGDLREGMPLPSVRQVAGDLGVHDHWGPGVVIDAKGEGSRAQATVDFESVGKKNLLLSATPLRRA